MRTGSCLPLRLEANGLSARSYWTEEMDPEVVVRGSLARQSRIVVALHVSRTEPFVSIVLAQSVDSSHTKIRSDQESALTNGHTNVG